MSVRLPSREAPPVRELLMRATWDDLDRIAARYRLQLVGRRRPLAVERLAGTLERPDQLRAAYGILPESARATLGLLMLLGSAEDERALAAARDRLLAARPDLATTLGRAHLANDLQTLLALGLCFVERRRLIVPLEVLNALDAPLLPTTEHVPVTQPRSFAQIRCTLESLMGQIERGSVVAIPTDRGTTGRMLPYQPTLIPLESANHLGQTIGVSPSEIPLWLTLLESLGAVAAVRGQWQVQAAWQTIRGQAPRDLLMGLINAWQQPHPLSDLARTGAFLWLYSSDGEGAVTVTQHESALRTMFWRWLRWSGTTAVEHTLCATMLAALHAPLLLAAGHTDLSVVHTTGQASRSAADDPAPIADALVRELTTQLATLGLISADEQAITWTPTACWLLDNEPLSSNDPPIESVGATTLLVHPLAVDPAVLHMIELAGTLLPPQDERLRYEIGPRGVSQLLETGVDLAEFEQALAAAGAQLGPDLRAQLAEWAHRAGRLRLHLPTTVLVTAEDAPLAQILTAAGIADAAEILGPGCALLEPEAADVAIEQLRARGFWPRTINPES